MKDFTFFAENTPEMPFAKKKLSRDGLPKAIERLQKAANERDFERIWRLLEGMRIRAEAEGFPVEQFKAFTQTIVEGGEVSTRTDLELKPILGGRVWQVMTADYDAPVTIKYKEDGGSTTMRPGRFWSKIKGKWRIVAD